MLVPETGRVRTWIVSRRRLAVAFVGLFVCAFVLGMLVAWQAADAPAVLDLVRRSHALAEAKVRAENEAARLREALAAERAKRMALAEELGVMQARIARLGVIGEKLVETARLDPKTFDTSIAPAFGGPPAPATGMPGPSLDAWIEGLQQQVDRLDAELAVVEAALMREQSQAEARPHLWPTKGGWISSGFGVRGDPFAGTPVMHRGVDIANRAEAPVYAASRGVIVFAGPMKDFGNMIEIDHGYGYRTRYGHLAKIFVRPGDLVEAGQLIGRIGSTGRSTGPHLHFEVHRYGQSIDPRPFLPKSS